MDRRRLWATVGICLAGAGLASGCGGGKPPASPAPEAPAKVAMPAGAAATDAPEPVAPAPDSPGKPSETAMPPSPAGRATSPGTDSDDQAVQLIEQIDEIGDKGAAAEDRLPLLVDALGDSSPEVRWHAARAMGLVGKDALPSIPRLVAMLEDADPLVVAQAATAIGRIKEDDTAPDGSAVGQPSDSYISALEALVKAVKHPDARVRRAALISIKRLQPDREVLADLLGSMLVDVEPSVVVAALRSIADIGPPAVPFLAESLGRPTARYWAAVALAEMGQQAAEATDELVAALADADPVERMQILLALAAIGEPAASGSGSLVEMLESDSDEAKSVRIPLVYALGQMRLEAAHEPLGRLLESNDAVLAGTAAWARARIHPDAADEVAIAVERLLKGVNSKDPIVRQGTLSALADLSEEVTSEQAARMAAIFGKSLSDPEVPVRLAGAESLARLGSASIPALLEAVEDPERRLIAIDVLGSLGSSAKDAVASLVRMLADADPTVRGDAAFALGSIGPDAVEAVPALLQLLTTGIAAAKEGGQQAANGDASDGHGHGPATYTAAYALGRIGSAAREALPVLESLTQSKDPMLATVGVWAALQIDPGRETLRSQAVPLLTRALKDEHDLVRLEASIALGEIGKAPRETVEMLEIVAEDDPVPTVRSAAADALRKLRGA